MTTPYLGEIRLFGFNYAPRNWAFCQGQLLNISQNQALFALIGTFYGGNGVTTFGLPDLRGRTAIGTGTGSNGVTTTTLGQSDGVENVVLTTANLPPHTHQLIGSTAAATQRGIAGGAYAADTDALVNYYAPAPA